MRLSLLILMAALAGGSFSSVAAQEKAKKPRTLKPGFNLFSKEQDVQMGQEYAKQVEQEMVVITNPTIHGFIENIGKKLAASPDAGGFPYTFKVVQEDSINAFALPGGPSFTHTGLIMAADNEGQIAGVLAHEISHAALRHGTNQASKANLIQLPAMIGAQMAGGGITGMLAQLGVGLGANSLLMKFSRNAERDADLLGTRIMSQAGYNPIEMARFFEKLQAQGGKESRLSEFMASHPNPGNRVKAVSEEILLLPKRDYMPDSGRLPAVKQEIQKLPKVEKPKPGQGAAPTGDPKNISAARPGRQLKEFKSQEVVFGYPDNWQIFQQQEGGSITISSPAGMFQNGALAYGVIADAVKVQQRDLKKNTQELLAKFQQQDQNVKLAGNMQSFRVNGLNAMAARMQGQSAFQGQTEALVLVTADIPAGMLYMLFVAPQGDMNYAQPIFDQMINSIQVPR
ncbi:MAG: M48 family metallopeptidase [Bryobacteraceae bacterium]